MIDGNGSRNGFWNEKPNMASTIRSVDCRAEVKSGTKGTWRFCSWIFRRCVMFVITPVMVNGEEIWGNQSICTPRTVRFCPAWGSRLTVDIRNALDGVRQRGHRRLYSY